MTQRHRRFSFTYPINEGIAVPTNSEITIALADRNNIDTNTLTCSVNGTVYSLASPSLSFDGVNLTYTPTTPLGSYGGTTTFALCVADILGNEKYVTNIFTLELEPVVSSDVMVVGVLQCKHLG